MPLSCDDFDECTADSCDEVTGCGTGQFPIAHRPPNLVYSPSGSRAGVVPTPNSASRRCHPPADAYGPRLGLGAGLLLGAKPHPWAATVSEPFRQRRLDDSQRKGSRYNPGSSPHFLTRKSNAPRGRPISPLVARYRGVKGDDNASGDRSVRNSSPKASFSTSTLL